MRRFKLRDRHLFIVTLLGAVACAQENIQDFPPPPDNSGGTATSGGSGPTGGSIGQGGSIPQGGTIGQGGSIGQGGTLPNGGSGGGSGGVGGSGGSISPFGGSAGMSGTGGGADGGSGGQAGLGGGGGSSGSSGASGAGGKGGSGGTSGAGGSGGKGGSGNGGGGSGGKGGSGNGGTGGGATGDCNAQTASQTVTGSGMTFTTTKDACLKLGPPSNAPFEPLINAEPGTADGYPISYTVTYCGGTLTGSLPSLYTTVRLFTGEPVSCEAYIQFEGNGDVLKLRYYSQ